MDKRFCLDEKDIYILLNEVKFDQSELGKAEDEMPEILKEKIKKNVPKKIRNRMYLKIAKRGAVAAAILLVLLMGAGTVSPVLAKNIPLVNSIFEILNIKFGHYEEYMPYSQLVNKSVTDSGITITITEALADDSKLILGYIISSQSRIDNLEVVGLSRFLKVNDSTVGGGVGAGQYLDDSTFMGSDQVSYSSPGASDRLKVDLNINDILGIKGKWNFAFTVSKDELVKNSSVFTPHCKVDLPDCLVTVDKIVFSPIDTTINFSGIYKDKNISAQTRAMEPFYTWVVFDDKGIELIDRGGSWGGNTNLPEGKDFKGNAQYEKANNIPQYLTIIPCRIIHAGGGGVSIDQSGQETPLTIKTKTPGESAQKIDGHFPFELTQGKMGNLIIKDIKTANNETVVRYTAEGKAPYLQGSKLHIKNAAGEYVTPKQYIKRDEEHPNEFTMVFPALEGNQQYSVSTSRFENIDFMEELKIMIELR